MNHLYTNIQKSSFVTEIASVKTKYYKYFVPKQLPIHFTLIRIKIIDTKNL